MPEPKIIVEALLECLYIGADGFPIISDPKELVLAIRVAESFLDPVVEFSPSRENQ